jgi:hypothetical protein
VRDLQTNTTERVSLSSSGAEANADSWLPSISPDGRFVAFSSIATNLVPGDTNGQLDVFVRDLQTNTTERVSLSSSGAEANADSWYPSISSDGRFVAFYTSATNLVPGDTNGSEDVLVRDLQTNTTERVSLSSSGAEANTDSWDPSISSDGRFVAFHTSATNLVPGDTNGSDDVFVRDLQTNTTERVSLSSSDAEANSSSSLPSISSDGRFVAFYTWATNLVPGDTNGSDDVLVRDLQTNTTERVSLSSSGAEANTDSWDPSISPDGRFVAFSSNATNLVADDTNGYADVFVHERGTPAQYSDNRPPTTTADGGTYTQDTWTNQNVTLTLTAADEQGGSGVKETRYRMGTSGVYQLYDATNKPSISSEGITTVSFYSTDVAGNVEDPPKTFTVKIDKRAPSAPTASFLDSSGNPVQPVYTDSSGVKWFKQPVTVHYGGSSDPDLADGTPGSGNISYTPEDTHSTDGTYNCSGTATDQAGNVSSLTSLKVGIDKSAPTAKVPTHSFTTLSTLATTTVPVKLSWSATDNTGGSGIASYQLQQSLNAGAYTNVALPSATATTITRSLAPGTNTYRYRVVAKDKAGNLSAWVSGPSFKVRVFQESSSAIVDRGTWTTSTLSGAYGGSVQYASALGRNATFTVPAGSKNVEWVSYRGNNRGKAQVWLDGVQQDANPNLTGIQPFDLYSSSVQARKVVFSKAVSPTTSHKLEIRVLGQKNASSTSTRVDIDAFVTTS